MRPSMILALAFIAVVGMSMTGFAADPPGPGDTKVETKTDTKAETKSDTKAETKSDAKAETKATLAPAEVKGEVLKIDGNTYFVNDERSKKEVKFTMEKDVSATLDRPLKQGDRIQAYLTPEGLAKRVHFESVKDDGMNKVDKGLGEGQAPGGLSRELPPSGTGSQQEPAGVKPQEGSNPTLSPSGKGSASGG
jgi:hypothetical protein